jgi:protein-tyrosine phosphatase
VQHALTKDPAQPLGSRVPGGFVKRWWIAEPRLLGSSNPTSDEVQALAREGFSLIVSLLDEAEQAPNYDVALVRSFGLERHNIPVRDFQPPTMDQLAQFLQLLDDANQKRVVVHCLGGSGRTGTFAAAYWMAEGMTASEAVLHVRKAKPAAVETREQLKVLSEFEQDLERARLQAAPASTVPVPGEDLELLPTGAELRASWHDRPQQERS